MEKIWANSGDSHLVEPDTLFEDSLPASLAARMPHSVKDEDGNWETIHVDGQQFRRRLSSRNWQLTDEQGRTVPERAPGANDPTLRLLDLDEEGIWAELIYPSVGIWTSSIRDPDLLAAGRAPSTTGPSNSSGRLPAMSAPRSSPSSASNRLWPRSSGPPGRVFTPPPFR